MDTNNDLTFSPTPVLTGGNAQELILGSTRRQPLGNRRDRGGPSRPPPGGDQPTPGRQWTDTGGVDPITQGFDRIMARFDQLEVRVDNLELPQSRDVDFGEEDLDLDDREYADYREMDGMQRVTNPRQRLLGFGDRRGARGGRRGGLDRREDSWRRTDWQQDGAFDDRLGPYQPRRLSNWDPPAARQRGGRDQRRRASCWDPPGARERPQYPYNPGAHHGVKMQAPHFDGSDATNWISRVEYYFDHIMMPDEDRLHYVVMLFDPPAAEWIFNYRNNNRYVTWPEFLEDIRHKFDP